MNEINGIDITTDVYIKSNYSFEDAVNISNHGIGETPNGHDQVESQENNYNNQTTDYEDQNFIFDEKLKSSQKELLQDDSQTLMETKIDIDTRDRHQSGIKPPK